MDALGIGYVIEHYISFFHKYQEEAAYRAYVTDALRLITENTAKAVQGSYIKARYADMIAPQKQETRTADEIIYDIKSKLEKLKNE